MKKLHLLKKAEFNSTATSGSGAESSGDNRKKKSTESSKSNGEKAQELIDTTVELANDAANIYSNPTNAYNYYSAFKHVYKIIKASGEVYADQMSSTGSVTYTGTAGNPITIKDPEKGKGSKKKGK